jgi:hypothetical protein
LWPRCGWKVKKYDIKITTYVKVLMFSKQSCIFKIAHSQRDIEGDV